MSRNSRRPVRECIVGFFIVTALCWVVFVFPLFAIGIGMFGSTIADGVRATADEAAAGDVLSIVMIALTLCLLGVPWALWVVIRER